MGGGSKKQAKGRLDRFYHLAKEQGLRSRAAFKLAQLDRRFRFLSGCKRGVIDLCAAPGGWMQIAVKNVPKGSPVLGIDLDPIKGIPGCESLIGDITSAKSAAQLRRLLVDCQKKKTADLDKASLGLVDAVLHDGAPNVGTSWISDAYGQNELVLHALRLAVGFLARGGTFVTKIFRSKDYNALVWVFRQLFDKVEATKPAASRAVSAEIFVCCSGFIKPKSVDPRLLDPKYVFADTDAVGVSLAAGASAGGDGDGDADMANGIAVDDDEGIDETNIVSLATRQALARAPVVLSEADAHKQLFARKLPRLKAEGYAEGATSSGGLMFEAISANRFITGDDPLALLVGAREISFNPVGPRVSADERALCRSIRDDPSTTDEIVDLCTDIRSLGKSDNKKLLKWRELIRESHQIRSAREVAAEAADDEEIRLQAAEQARLDAMTDDERLTQEIEQRIASLKLKRKKIRRKLATKHKKRQYAIDVGMIHKGDRIDQSDLAGPDELFNVPKAEVDDSVLTAVVPDDAYESSEDDAPEADSGDEDMDYLERIERELESNYRRLEARRQGLAYDETLALESGPREISKLSMRRLREDRTAHGLVPPDEEDDRRFIENPRLRLAASKKGVPSLPVPDAVTSVEASRWFSQDVFAGAATFAPHVSEGESESEQEEPGFDSDAYADSDNGDAEAASAADRADEDASDQDLYRGMDSRKRQKTNHDAPDAKKDDGGFEVVPRENVEELYDGMDDHDKAAALAVGSLLVNGKLKKDHLEDAAYNRYAFADAELSSTPVWFQDDESQHNKPQAPITKEQVEEYKRYIREINARPMKKVAEAKARKKLRAARKLEQIKAKAEAIADTDDLTPGEKLRQIETLYKLRAKAKNGKKVDRKYIVGKAHVVKSGSRAGGRRNSSKSTKYVDGRLKADSRAEKAQKRKSIARGKKRRASKM